MRVGSHSMTPATEPAAQWLVLAQSLRTHGSAKLWQAVRFAWASPCTAVGVLFALPALLAGGRIERTAGVWEVAIAGRRPLNDCPRPLRYLFRCLPFAAITFGHVVIGRTALELVCLRAHEHEHVRQYERWGVLFWLAYPASSALQLLRGKRAYLDNCFEVQARQRCDAA